MNVSLGGTVDISQLIRSLETGANRSDRKAEWTHNENRVSLRMVFCVGNLAFTYGLADYQQTRVYKVGGVDIIGRVAFRSVAWTLVPRKIMHSFLSLKIKRL